MNRWIYHTTIDLKGDRQQWQVGAVSEMLTPQAPYECPDLPNSSTTSAASKASPERR
jgi:hypothetical protein